MAVLLEARPFRPFKSSEEYLYAMKEDLAEWLHTLYPELGINVDNFMDRIDTGVVLCKVSTKPKKFHVNKCWTIFSFYGQKHILILGQLTNYLIQNNENKMLISILYFHCN